MRQRNWKEFWVDVLVDIVAGFLIAIGVYNFALNANFPVAGFSGIAIIMYHLMGLPVGAGTILLNVPVADFLLQISRKRILFEVSEKYGDFFCSDGLCSAASPCV